MDLEQPVDIADHHIPVFSCHQPRQLGAAQQRVAQGQAAASFGSPALIAAIMEGAVNWNTG
jgi:hypothetical protein